MSDSERTPIVICVVKHEKKILLVHRGSNHRFYPDVWGGISGFLNQKGKSVEERAKEKVREEAGIEERNIVSIRESHMIEQEDKHYNKIWQIHPVLVDVADDFIRLSSEEQSYEWVSPQETFRFELFPGFDEVLQEVLFPSLLPKS